MIYKNYRYWQGVIYWYHELIISLETGSWALNYTWCKFGLYQLSSLQLGTDVTDTWHEKNFYGQAKTAYHNKLSSLHNGTAAIQHSESNRNEGKRLVLLLRTGISAVSFFYFNSTTASVCRSKLGVLSTFGVINDYVSHSLKLLWHLSVSWLTAQAPTSALLSAI